MKFLINAHLPRRIVRRLVELGHDALHTMDLPRGNRTSDSFINVASFSRQGIDANRSPVMFHPNKYCIPHNNIPTAFAASYPCYTWRAFHVSTQSTINHCQPPVS
ncbi:MAG: DUF5615 family PIN-like protein [Anaerolineae bacterium]|nr:DUF5615 family PIN-like protein [Anaerolineae bacterium]